MGGGEKIAPEYIAIAQVYYELAEGLEFILGHFPNDESLFPRTVMTKVTVNLGRGQRTVYDKGTILSYFEGALGEDCRISAYPKYKELMEKGLLAPDYKPKPTQLFIDLDLSTFDNDRNKLDAALCNTLRYAEQHTTNGTIPTVLWTGGGYHIYLPLDCDCVPVYEDLPEFKRYRDDRFPPSVKFIRYAEKRLSNGKSDKNHSPSFDSCLWRIPGSINPKYTGEDAKVRIVQRWNGVRARLSKDFMHTDFLLYLAQERINQIRKESRNTTRINKGRGGGLTLRNRNDGFIPTPYCYVEEKLLKTPIEDYRKHAINLIIIPYFVVVKRLTNMNQIYAVAMQWLDKCNQIKGLEPSRRRFEAIVKYRIREVMHGYRVPPMRWETLKNENPWLYEKLESTL